MDIHKHCVKPHISDKTQIAIQIMRCLGSQIRVGLTKSFESIHCATQSLTKTWSELAAEDRNSTTRKFAFALSLYKNKAKITGCRFRKRWRDGGYTYPARNPKVRLPGLLIIVPSSASWRNTPSLDKDLNSNTVHSPGSARVSFFRSSFPSLCTNEAIFAKIISTDWI